MCAIDLGMHTCVCMWGLTWACIRVSAWGVDMGVHTCVCTCVGGVDMENTLMKQACWRYLKINYSASKRPYRQPCPGARSNPSIFPLLPSGQALYTHGLRLLPARPAPTGNTTQPWSALTEPCVGWIPSWCLCLPQLSVTTAFLDYLPINPQLLPFTSLHCLSGSVFLLFL